MIVGDFAAVRPNKTAVQKCNQLQLYLKAGCKCDSADLLSELLRVDKLNRAGIAGGWFGKVEPRQPREIVPEAEALIGAAGADFRIGGDQAFYVPKEDFIRIPNQTSYTDQINYYRTAFHELGHWTGHKSRLDRSLTTKFGTVDNAREELVAEMATAFVCASLGIVPTVRHADYIGNLEQF